MEQVGPANYLQFRSRAHLKVAAGAAGRHRHIARGAPMAVDVQQRNEVSTAGNYLDWDAGRVVAAGQI